jgi:hypothetical protein
MYIQGAVEASRKSVEQQGQFAKQLEAQGQLVSLCVHFCDFADIFMSELIILCLLLCLGRR